MTHETISEVAGATILSVVGMRPGSTRVELETTAGRLVLRHEQDCCEVVDVEDIIGDPELLVGATIREFRESFKDDATGGPYGGDGQWTFYHVITDKEDVTIRWYGTSNGYYSIAVSVFFNDARCPRNPLGLAPWSRLYSTTTEE